MDGFSAYGHQWVTTQASLITMQPATGLKELIIVEIWIAIVTVSSYGK
jgi:hypothetical protein